VKVAMVGTGYVGLTCAAVFAHVGHEVTAADVDAEKVHLLQSGGNPIFEPYLTDLLANCRKRIRFTDDTAGAAADSDLIMLAVGTPARADGSADLSQIDAAIAEVARGLTATQHKTIVLKSTAPVGNCRRIGRLLRALVPGAQFSIVSNPEFLPQGSAVRDSLYPDRIVAGTDDDAGTSDLRQLYAPILERSFSPVPGLQPPPDRGPATFLVMDSNSAELSKYAANAFLAMKISFINEIANVAELAGADVGQVARVLSLDPRIGGAHLKAGIGYGGSCFPKDTRALHELAGGTGYDFRLLKAIIEVNNAQWQWVVRTLGRELGDLAGKRVGLLGLAFKAGTDDVRESPALAIAEVLLQQGAEVLGYDPAAGARAAAALPGMKICSSPVEAATGADAIAIVTDWPMFRDLDWSGMAVAMRSPLVLDGRRVLADARPEGVRLFVLGTGNVEE